MIDSLIKRQSIQVVNRFLPILKKATYADSAIVKREAKLKELEKKDRTRQTEEFEEHFIENLFLNKFQEKILTYPEINSLKEVKSITRSSNYARKLLAVSTQSNEVACVNDSDNIVSTIKKFELSGFKLPVGQKGFGYLTSEYTYLQEALSENLSLSKTIAENEDLGIQLINLYGNSSQKEKYLLKLASGESMTCFGHKESGPFLSKDFFSSSMIANLTADGENYRISGKKNWVYNATYADVMIFSANVTSVNENGERKTGTTFFLIDKNLSGITVNKMETVGFKGLDVCEVTFNEVLVPSTCVLGNIHDGNKIVKSIFAKGKANYGAMCITTMKKLINLTVKHCISNKFFKKNMHELNGINITIGNIVARLYSVESMTYLLTGRMDMYEDADVFLESIILKIYASESLQYVLNQVLGIIGKNYYNDGEYDKLEGILRDSQFFLISEDTNDYLKILLSTYCCEYVMEYRNEASLFSKIIDALQTQKIKEMITLPQDQYCVNIKKYLEGFVHRVLGEETYILEDCCYNLKKTVDYLFDKYKDDILNRPAQLKQLAEMVVYIYAITASLGRCSRAYCLGMRHQENDRFILTADFPRVFFDFRKKIALIKNESYSTGLEKLGSDILQSKVFPEVNPVLSKELLQK